MSFLQPTFVSSWCKLNYFIRSLSSQPFYNYGLPGKGKSSSHLQAKSVPNVQGEVLFGHHPTILALKARKRQTFYCVYVDSKFKDKENRSLAVQEIFELASQQNVPVQLLTRNVLDHLAGNRPHQGVCMDVDTLPVSEWSYRDLLARYTLDWQEQLINLEDGKPFKKYSDRTSSLPLWLFLHNVKDPMNFGAILRTAHYLGIDQVVFPSSNSCKLSPVVSKASAGALEITNLMKLPNSVTEVEFCKWWQSQQNGVVMGTGAAMEGGDRSVMLERFTVSHPTLVILGNEGSGMGKELEECCDQILTIPGHESTQMAGNVQSLNVSVAAGILLHWIKTSSMKKLQQ